MSGFPTCVYKKSRQHPDFGKPFILKRVQTPQEKSDALANGWFATVKEALSGKSKQVQAAQPVKPVESTPVPDDNAPPTRVELEAKAKELGIDFDGRTSDAGLLRKIDHKLGHPKK